MLLNLADAACAGLERDGAPLTPVMIVNELYPAQNQRRLDYRGPAKTIAGINASLWQRLPGLAAGHSNCSFSHMARPLLVAIDPAAGKLRMTE